MARVKPGDPLPKGLYWRGDVIWVRCISGGTDKRVSTFGQSIHEGEALLARLRSERDKGKLDRALGRKAQAPTVGELIDRFLPEWRDKTSWADSSRYAAEWKEQIGGVRADELVAGDVLAALKALQKEREKPLGNAALNRRRQFLQTVYTRAMRDQVVESNPVTRVKKLEEVPRVRYADPEQELGKLWAACNPTHLAVFSLAILTGLRRGHILRLTTADVDIPQRLLRVERTAGKKRAPRLVPLNEEALQAATHLVERAQEKGSPWLVPGKDPAKPMEATALSRAFSRAATRAGLKNLRLHDMRHSFASYLTQAGVDGLTLQEAGGWESASMVRRYAHADVASRRAAMDKLPKIR